MAPGPSAAPFWIEDVDARDRATGLPRIFQQKVGPVGKEFLQIKRIERPGVDTIWQLFYGSGRVVEMTVTIDEGPPGVSAPPSTTLASCTNADPCLTSCV